MRKDYGDFTDTEKFWVREYSSWAKATCNIELRWKMMEQYQNYLKSHNINIHDYT